jgi:hypothetical protein
MIRRVVSLQGDNLVVFLPSQLPNKRCCLRWEKPYKRGTHVTHVKG